MKAASVNELKEELKQLPAGRLVEICLRLARYKMENKELLNYLLIESGDEHSYINAVKNLIASEMSNISNSNLYFAKKSIRKILRIANKHIRYIGTKQAEAELLLSFCTELKRSGIAFEKSTALHNLFLAQLKKVSKAIDTMHEDLQYDYKKELDKLDSI